MTSAKPSESARFIVGLTGGIGSGKTTVANMLGAMGATLVDADLIAHQLTTPGGAAMPAIIAAFGADIATADGAMDRARMRERVFQDPSQRARLEGILHPMIRAENERQVREATGDYVIMVVPLLVESGRPRERVDRVAVVDCPTQLQIERVQARSQLPIAQIQAIMAAQATREQRLAAADDVIDNSGDTKALMPQLQALHRRYLELARAKRAAR